MKDIKDTFKPYKTNSQLWRDLFKQPFYGLGNTIRGVVGLVLSPFIFLAAIISIPFVKDKTHLFKFAGLTFAASAFAIFRGITQIAATPLTWLRIPLRALITYFKGRPNIEDNKGLLEVQGFAALGVDIAKDVLEIKWYKSVLRGQRHNLSLDEVSALPLVRRGYNDSSTMTGCR
ncbi:MAG: hypothetical protein NTW08_09825 [Gammaproteobacteria bacterium]|nr:hypothetical protein [Gammaproteobacteria bacterium]